MFTGLVQGVGRLAGRDSRDQDARLRIEVGSLPFAAVQPGESISVNGACLTVVSFDALGFEADAVNETLALTTLGTLPLGAALNLERAMRADDRLGGHLVTGHIDGVGHVRRKGMEPGSRTDEPGAVMDTNIVELSPLEWRVLAALKREFTVSEITSNPWRSIPAAAGR